MYCSTTKIIHPKEVKGADLCWLGSTRLHIFRLRLVKNWLGSSVFRLGFCGFGLQVQLESPKILGFVFITAKRNTGGCAMSSMVFALRPAETRVVFETRLLLEEIRYIGIIVPGIVPCGW